MRYDSLGPPVEIHTYAGDIRSMTIKSATSGSRGRRSSWIEGSTLSVALREMHAVGDRLVYRAA
jgi:hypothetical protein